MAKKRGLGGGLENLIPQAQSMSPDIEEMSKEGGGVQTLNITQIEPNKAQARKKFDEDKLNELAESIKQHGMINPIIVLKKGERYEIIAGERRWRAAHKADIQEVPVIIKEDLTEQELDEISLIENIQREDLNPIEEARAYKKLIEVYQLKQDELADRVSKSRTAITNSMRLLKLSEQVQQMLIDEMLTTGHARALITIEDPEEQLKLAQRIFDESLSVRETEKLIKGLLNKKEKPEKKESPLDHNLETVYRGIEDDLTQTLGTKVKISTKDGNKGKLEIEFYTNDDLEKIIGRLK